MNVRRSFLVTLGLALFAACEGPAVLSRKPPSAEFLLAAGDSTYWIRSSAEGLRVRSAPILLTYTDGHFYEVFISDDVHDFDQASFASARVFQRDIMRPDSVLIFEDATVSKEARDWMIRHPGAEPLDPDDDTGDEPPPTFVSDDIEVIDVHGPWLSYGHSIDVDVAGRTGHRHQRRQGVIDVRTGTRTSLHALFGAAEAERLGKGARASFVELSDSVRRSTDERGAAARRTLASFVFDSMSFGLTEISHAPAIAYLVPGTGEQGEALSIHLPPQTASAPAWWSSIASTLPKWNNDSTELNWARNAYSVLARPSSDGDVIAIELVDKPKSGAARHWAVATVPAPAYQLIPLDNTPLDSTTRNALARAFDQSSVVNSGTQTASLNRRPQQSLQASLLRSSSSSSSSSLRAVSRRVSSGHTDNVGNTCCRAARRICRDARAELSALHNLPACPDTRHSDSGHRRWVAGL